MEQLVCDVNFVHLDIEHKMESVKIVIAIQQLALARVQKKDGAIVYPGTVERNVKNVRMDLKTFQIVLPWMTKLNACVMHEHLGLFVR